ncbi:hypothetical protein HPB48_000107 [Haemaphysalis longicornis]|uniref:Uncharacterized protein n=1 Tax=Haemaphysalis longicornis TaxID=44386 RepID=A0A9J6FT19_HAELO|nr:hypothetical protein HPB48_000107 [Haemaphysalis longicornis]
MSPIVSVSFHMSFHLSLPPSKAIFPKQPGLPFQSNVVLLKLSGVGIVLITVSGIAWRLTSHEAPSCRAMLGLRGDEPRRFVPRVPPYGGGRPSHPYAAMLYPEFQYRPPPPSYQASMQEYRLRLLLLDRQGGGPPALPTPVALAAHHHHHHHHHSVVPAAVHHGAPIAAPPPHVVTSPVGAGGIVTAQPGALQLSPVSPPPTYRSGVHASLVHVAERNSGGGYQVHFSCVSVLQFVKAYVAQRKKKKYEDETKISSPRGRSRNRKSVSLAPRAVGGRIIASLGVAGRSGDSDGVSSNAAGISPGGKGHLPRRRGIRCCDTS